MTEVATATTPEDEAKTAALAQYELIVGQRSEYGWEPALVDADDYLVVFVRIVKPGGRTFVLRLRCDDYPEVAPELRFVDPSTFDNPSEDIEPAAEFYPKGDSIAEAGQRGPLPVLCIKGHRDYYAGNWHSGWSNPPAHDHSPYQLVMNVRNAILDRWS
jgi:hypothetical protein